MKNKNGKDSALIEGSLEALTGLLYTFSVVLNQNDLKKIHEILLILISKNIPKRSTAQGCGSLNLASVALNNSFVIWFRLSCRRE